MRRPFSLSFSNMYGKAAPMSDALIVPPEWAPQAAVWVGWPHLRGEWGDAFEGARQEIAGFVRALCKVTPVKIACGSKEAYGSAWFALEAEIADGRVALHTLLAGDIWLRDTGPIVAFEGQVPMALTFKFNGWGGKYVMPGDTMTAGGIVSVEQIGSRSHPFTLEGGAVDVDGVGHLLTTRECVLNPNRNAGWTKQIAAQHLKQAFGVETIIWLGEGLRNDHTDGHVDNIARFIGPGRVLCQTPSGPDDPNADRLTEIEATLRRSGFEVVTVPSPGRVLDDQGECVPASHANFLISNGHVFLPIYEDRFAPQAVETLEALMPDHNIIALPARNILSGGGAFHCMTQQVPEPLKATK
ncbi:MAG: agmatine deiminase family protein [Henriciella sp.]